MSTRKEEARVAANVPPEDRRAFVEANAVVLVAQKEAKIDRLRQEVTRLNQRLEAWKRIMDGLRGDNAQLRRRLQEAEGKHDAAEP